MVHQEASCGWGAAGDNGTLDQIVCRICNEWLLSSPGNALAVLRKDLELRASIVRNAVALRM
ncbi:MAG: hypothetical protein WCP86_06405, partial [bacterium]